MKNKALMIAFVVIVLIFSISNAGTAYTSLKGAARDYIKGEEEITIKEAIGQVESSYKTDFVQKYTFIDICGAFQKLLNQKSCNGTIKCENGSLIIPTKYEIDVTEQASEICKLKALLEKEGIEFVCVFWPSKEGYLKKNDMIPRGVESYIDTNQEKLLAQLRNNGVDVVDLRDSIIDEASDCSDIYYNTDHHWKPSTGFIAYTLVAEELNKRYGYALDEESLNFDNYDITVVNNQFLGSSGKRTGLTYAGEFDSVEKIVPKRDTEMELNADGDIRKGSYEDVVFLQSALEGKYYLINPYAYYFGADYALTVQKNKDAANPDKQMLIIEDSYSLVEKPYYSFMFGEVAAIDARRSEANGGIKVADFVKKNKPDIVVLQYTEGQLSMDGEYGNPYDFGL